MTIDKSKQKEDWTHYDIPGGKRPIDTIIDKLDKDLRHASKTIGRQEARYLVDTYYQFQQDRIRCGLRAGATEENVAMETLAWVQKQSERLEKRVALMLDLWSFNHPVGPWLRGIHGIGPIISAGLIAHLDIEKAATAGHFWAIAGLDPSKTWEKGEKRPWNQKLKRLCFLIGESFMKSAASDKSYYGPVYKARKEYEWAKNMKGDYADQARAALEKKRFGDDTMAKKWYSGEFNKVKFSIKTTKTDVLPNQADRLLRDNTDGYEPGADALGGSPKGLFVEGQPGIPMLPPGRILSRAKRYAVKLFLAHLHEIWYELHYGKQAPLPYPISSEVVKLSELTERFDGESAEQHLARVLRAVMSLGHVHKIEPPNRAA